MEDLWGGDPLRFAGAACIFDHNAQSARSVVICKVTKYPYARMVHFNDGRDALGCTDPKYGNGCRVRYWIAVECDDSERMTRECEASNLGRTSIEHMKQHTLALFHANGIAMAEHAAVNGERAVVHLVTMGHPLRHRCLHRCRSEEHTSELQSLRHLVCRLLLEKKKRNNTHPAHVPAALHCVGA